MKKIILLIALIIGISELYAQSTESQFHNRKKIIEINLKSIDEVSQIAKIATIDEHFKNLKKIRAYADDIQIKKLNELGFSIITISQPKEEDELLMATTIEEMAKWDRYPTYEVYLQLLQKMADDHPDICRLVTIGKSEENRKIQALKITDNPDVHEAEPDFLYTGQMHGDELIGYIMLLRLADHLLNNYQKDAYITNLINSVEIWINPLSNPDGTYKGGNNTVADAQRFNANGVDPNRNFPSPLKPEPAYVDEAEVKNMIDFADNHNFVMSANIHSGAELVNYPWDTWSGSYSKSHADNEWWVKVSRNYVDTVHLINSSYMTDRDDGITNGGDWYEINGSRQDNMMYFKHCREFTLELSYKKMLPSKQLPKYWRYNKNSLVNYIQECLYGFNGTVKNTDGEPLNAKIEIIDHDKDNSEVYTDSITGDYYRPIAPGIYQVEFSSEGYKPQTHTITINYWAETVVKNVVLEKEAVEVGINTPHFNNYEIYPNPCQSHFSIKTNQPQNIISIQIIDVYGNLLAEPTTFTNINIKDLPKGLYFVRLNLTDKIITQKLVVE